MLPGRRKRFAGNFPAAPGNVRGIPAVAAQNPLRVDGTAVAIHLPSPAGGNQSCKEDPMNRMRILCTMAAGTLAVSAALADTIHSGGPRVGVIVPTNAEV